MFQRAIETAIDEYLTGNSHKILFIWGPRRSGKTTLLEKISQKAGIPVFNFDSLSDREPFSPDSVSLEKLVKENRIILIDEVQNYPESTLALKLLHDKFKVKVVATGSSELRKKSQDFDTLVGRYEEQFCLPFSVEEIKLNTKTKAYEENAFFRNLAVYAQTFGLYPEVYTSVGKDLDKIDILENIIEAYVLKDIANIYNLKNLKLAKDILTKIALQLGSEVSLREIAGSLGANLVTVSNYIEIFSKNYILIPVYAFKTNLRRAVSENRKLFFFDLGLRNALVKDFRELELRPDKGGLFENFIVSEIEKVRKNRKLHLNIYFYREYAGKEVDIVLEDYEKNYTCFEIKHKHREVKPVFPIKHKLKVVTLENYQTHIFSSRTKL